MMTTRPCHAKHSGHYYSEPQKGTFRSQWHGKGAAELGLSGSVEKPDFAALLQGYQPDGERLAVNLRKDRIAGWDCTFSAPKSVSIGILIEGNRELLLAHRSAVNEVVKEIEQGVQTRIRQRGKASYIDTKLIVAASFEHTLSRDLDPQIHTHVVVVNTTKNKGKWRSLHLKRGLFDRIKALGQLYQDKLAERLKALGHKLRITKHGLIEIARYPEELLKAFSKRRQGIEEMVGAEASSGRRQWASLSLRKAKEEPDLSQLSERWAEEYRRILIDRDRTVAIRKSSPLERG